jgi:hypothetical protein
MQTLLARPKYKIGLEMIDFQKDSFGKDLEIQITEVVNKIKDRTYRHPDDVEDSKEVKSIASLIFKRLGLQVKIICDGPLAAVLPFYSNRHHVFVDAMWRGEFYIKEQEKILKKASIQKGFVDSKNAKVGGFFSDYVCPLYVHFHAQVLDFDMSAAEIAAIIMHELGHAFTACEYSDRLDTNNQILTAVAQELTSKKEKANVTYIYRELEKVNPDITEEEVDKLVNGNKVVAGYVWMRTVIGSVQKQLPQDTYDKTSFEQMSDNFSARFGYGRELISGLQKLHVYYGDPQTSKAGMRFTIIMEAISHVAISFLAVASLFLMPAYGVVMTLVMFLVFRLSADDMRDYTYDELKLRYTRIRHQLVERLKDKKLGNKEVQELLDSVYMADKMIKNTHLNEGLFRAVSNFVFTSARDARKSILEQQLMEELTHNDMFVMAAQLKTQST